MGKSYSIDLRERVQAAVASRESRRATARRYDVSASFAVKLVDHVSRTGSAEPARQGRPPGGGKLAPHLPTLLVWVLAAVMCTKRHPCDSRVCFNLRPY